MAGRDADEVLDFWFGTPDEDGHGERRDKWFAADPAFDAEIARRFAGLCARAAAGDLEAWRDEARACLALVLLLDQFPRNVFRGTARAFAADARARAVANHAIARGYDRAVPAAHRTFFYLPFEHSEDRADQERSVALFRDCPDHPGHARALDYAVRHFEVIARFGRFPHRNAILGRRSTPEEAAFLAEHETGF